jgi:molybdate transport system substrate-binding protein
MAARPPRLAWATVGHCSLLFLFALMVPSMVSAETIRVYAAGSLRSALTEAGRAFEAKNSGLMVEVEFAASGLLRERIENGDRAHVFASADVGHPAKLATAGFARSKVAVFARNQLCALAREGLQVTPETLLPAMLDAGVRVGISTPKADPSGDYAWALFAKAEALHPGARAKLEGKALQLTGGPASEKAPAGKNQYAWVMSSGKADVFLTYCTNAVLARREVPSLQIVHVTPDLNVSADYGMIVLKDAPDAADRLARFILGKEGQAILAKHGFGRGDDALE